MTSTSRGRPDPTGFHDPAQVSGPLAVGKGGRYELGAVLGRGGMADVYRATDTTLGRDVAVKLLRERTPDPVDRARIVAEAQTLARLNHPNLVTILDAGISDDRPFLVLELVSGTSLSVALREAGQGLGSERVARIGAQIAAGLAHCHAAGIVHRDVKPANILLDSTGRALLTDFGISRLLDGTTHHTQTGFTIGTAGYFAPEQVTGDVLTPAVDMYALGLVLLEAVTGRREYTGAPLEAAVARLHRSPAIPVSLPSSLAGTLSALTRTEPVTRPSAAETAAVLAHDSAPSAAPLDAAEATQASALAAMAAPAGANDVERVQPAPARTEPGRRRGRPTVFAFLGWAAAAAAAVALVLTWHGARLDPATTENSTGSESKPTQPAEVSPSPARATSAADVDTASAKTTQSRTSAQPKPGTKAPGRAGTDKAKGPADAPKGPQQTKPEPQAQSDSQSNSGPSSGPDAGPGKKPDPAPKSGPPGARPDPQPDPGAQQDSQTKATP